jgi:hypothetical protein
MAARDDSPAGGDPFATLPHALALAIFSRLTVEQRLRCIEVCRGWRAMLADYSSWLRLDLTRADGSKCSEALLRAATSRAGGKLRLLHLACGDELHGSLCAVAAGNATTLQELRISAPAASPPQSRRTQHLEALLRAAPQLRTLEADVYCGNAAEARRVLRNAPPFGPLRVRQLSAHAATADAVLALAADLVAHASLTSVWLCDAPLDAPAALDAVVDAALARRLSSVQLTTCGLSPASAPALARLLGGNTLTELSLDHTLRQLLDAPAAMLLANALRANTSLTALALDSIELWRDAAAAAELMGALKAHPRLRRLSLSWNDGSMHAAEAGAALAALLLANAPPLQTLNISLNFLYDAGMAPVVDALRHNTHLTKLDCSENRMSEAFARNTLLPAVRTNTSLRELFASDLEGDEEEDEDDVHEDDRNVAAREAEALVAARTCAQLH